MEGHDIPLQRSVHCKPRRDTLGSKVDRCSLPRHYCRCTCVLIGKPRIDRPADPPHRARRARGVASGQQRCVDGSGRRFNTRSHVTTVEMVFRTTATANGEPEYKTGGATENSANRRPTGALHDPSYAATGDRELGFLPGQNCAGPHRPLSELRTPAPGSQWGFRPGTLPSSWAPVRPESPNLTMTSSKPPRASAIGTSVTGMPPRAPIRRGALRAGGPAGAAARLRGRASPSRPDPCPAGRHATVRRASFRRRVLPAH